MSWKSANSSDTGQGAAPSRPGTSLTLWFALCNALSAFIILALIALLLYFGLAAQLKSQNHHYLHAEVSLVERFIRADGVTAALDEVSVDQHGEEYLKHFIRILDRNGRVVAETEGMAAAAPHAGFPVPPGDGIPAPDTQWRNADGSLMLGTSVAVEVGKKARERGVVEVALDVTNVNSILVAYRIRIYGVLLVGLLLCISVSFAIARKGTRPIREMTEMVRGITVTNLKERISGDEWPKELRILASAMNLMLDRLDDSFSRLYNSATNLSHKMRTPLTILRGEAEIALSRSRSVEELQDVIASSLEENDRLLRLIENILFLANAETGKLQLNPAVVDLREELEKVVDFYTPCAEEKGISISCQGEAFALADAPLFRKVAAALLSNALTYNTPGGTVEMVLRQGEGEGECGELSVTDSGCGIPDHESSKIFDRFYRIYATRHMDPHGTGLGLPIVQAAMALHNGVISLKSTPGQRTTVIVTFPPRPA